MAAHTDKAFNQGADARMMGEPITYCPYNDAERKMFWQAGWREVDRFWGAKAKWPVQRIPSVRGGIIEPVAVDDKVTQNGVR